MHSHLTSEHRRELETRYREEYLLQLAVRFAEEHGAESLTLTELAKASPFSRATVYNHFSTREELLLALSGLSVRMQIDQADTVLGLGLSPLGSVVGLACTYLRHARINGALFQYSVSGRSDANIARCSRKRVRDRLELETRLANRVVDAATAALADYRGTLPVGESIEAVRAFLTGYAMSHYQRKRFVWDDSGESTVDHREETGAHIPMLSAVLTGLGWSGADVDFTREVEHALAGRISDDDIRGAGAASADAALIRSIAPYRDL